MYAPNVFDGVHPDQETWLAHFKRYATCRQLTEDQLAFFRLFLKGAAIDWYDTQATQRTSMEELLAEFIQFFCPTPLDRVMDREIVLTRVHERTEKIRDYFSAMQKLAKRIPGVDEDLLKGIIRGLQPQIKAFVLQHQGAVKSVGDILEVARVAETAIGTTTAQGDMSAIMDEIKASRAEVRQLTNRVDKMSVGSVSRRSPTPESRRVTFAPGRRSPARNDNVRGQAGGRPFRRGVFRTSTTRPQPNGSSCYRCGRSHYGECPAINVNCYNCGRRGHSVIVAVGRAVACGSVLLHREERPSITWAGWRHRKCDRNLRTVTLCS